MLWRNWPWDNQEQIHKEVGSIPYRLQYQCPIHLATLPPQQCDKWQQYFRVSFTWQFLYQLIKCMCQLSNYFWGAGRENVQIIFRGYKLIDLLVLTKAVFVLVWCFPFVESLINWLFSQSDNKSLHLCFQIIVFQILLHNYEKVWLLFYHRNLYFSH